MPITYKNTTDLFNDVVAGTASLTTVGGAGGTQYTDGVTQITPVGTVAFGKNPSNVLKSLSLDASGNLNINLAAGTISGNSAASATGAAVPANAGYTGFNSGGLLVGISTTNPLPVVQTGTLSTNATIQNASIAVTGPLTDTQLRASVVPTSVSNFPASQAVTVTSGAISATLAAETTKVIGTINVAAAQTIAVTNAVAANLNANVSGSVSVSNLPAIQAVSGTVSPPLPGSDYSALYASIVLQQETQQAMLLQLRAIRIAIVALVTESGRYQPDDFNPQRPDFSDTGLFN